VFQRFKQQRRDRKLVKAVLKGDAEAVEALLKQGASPEAISAESGNACTLPLSFAAMAGRGAIAKLLLDRRASVDIADGEGRTPMDYAVLNGHYEIAREICARGQPLQRVKAADIHIVNKRLLDAAADGKVSDMELLLACGADLEARGGNDVHWNGTPLSVAAYKGFLEATRFLLDRGANINAVDKDGDTILNAAIIHEKVDVVEELLKRGADPAIRSQRNENAADVARKKTSHRLHELLGIASEMGALTTADDEITFRRPFGARVLEETFNFAAKERISLILKTADGPVEAMSRESFAVIGDRAGLRRAYDAYAAKGGKVPEDDIFPESLGKVKAAPPRPGE
jgi:ankyrin repeat protein